MKRISPGLALLLIAPIFGELVSGHQSLFQFIDPLNFLWSALPYGLGALICRELKVRWGKGWFALVLLGIAYGIYEEAIVARSVWDPNWAELGVLRDYTFWQGVTWTYGEILIHFHLTISILSSVVFAEIIYYDSRHERWLSDRALVASFIGLALWMPVLMLLNPFMPPLGGFVLSWGVIAILAYAAWRLPAQVFPARVGACVQPFWYGVVAVVNTAATFLLAFILPEMNPSWLPPWPMTFVLIALLDAGAFWLVMRWSGNGTDWDERHKLALVIGLLTFFLVLDAFSDLDQGFGGLSIVAVLAVWGLWRQWTRTKARILANT